MDLPLSEYEARAIKIWADSTIHGGHWGDGDIEIPEETILLKKLQNIQHDKISITQREAQILLMWSESTLGIHTIEEEHVIKKLKSLLPQKESEGILPSENSPPL